MHACVDSRGPRVWACVIVQYAEGSEVQKSNKVAIYAISLTTPPASLILRLSGRIIRDISQVSRDDINVLCLQGDISCFYDEGKLWEPRVQEARSGYAVTVILELRTVRCPKSSRIRDGGYQSQGRHPTTRSNPPSPPREPTSTACRR